MNGGFPSPFLSVGWEGASERKKAGVDCCYLFQRKKKHGILASVTGACAAIFGCQTNCGSFLLEPVKDHVYQTTAHAYQVRGKM